MFRVVCALAAILCLSAATLQAQTETTCPLRFDRHTTGLPRTCLFVGRYNPGCGGNAFAVFAGDGAILVVGIATTPGKPIIYLPAAVESAQRGIVVRWADTTAPDPEALGEVSLEDGGRTLRLRGAPGLFRVDDCPFAEYVGRFVEMVDAGPDASRFAVRPTPGVMATPGRN